MKELLGYEKVGNPNFYPYVETEVICVDYNPGSTSLITTRDIKQVPEIGSVILNQYIVADYKCWYNYNRYNSNRKHYVIKIYVVTFDNWTPTPDNEKYYGWYTQRSRYGPANGKVEVYKIWVERNEKRGRVEWNYE